MENTKINTLKLDMVEKVVDFLSANINAFPPVSSLNTAIEHLIQQYQRLRELYNQLDDYPESGSTGKDNFRDELIRHLEPIVILLRIFAFDHRKKKMNDKLQHYTTSYFRECSDIELINATRKIWIMANKAGGYSLIYMKYASQKKIKNTTEMIQEMESDYGLTPEMIQTIEEVNLLFIQSLNQFESELAEKTKIVGNITKCHKKINDLLENNIDLFMQSTFMENQELIGGYLQSRKIGKVNADENLSLLQDTNEKDKITRHSDEHASNAEVEELQQKFKELVH